MLKAMPARIFQLADELRCEAARLESEEQRLIKTEIVLRDMEPLRTLCDELHRRRLELEAEHTKLRRYADALAQVAGEYQDVERQIRMRACMVHPGRLIPYPIHFSELDLSDLSLND